MAGTYPRWNLRAALSRIWQRLRLCDRGRSSAWTRRIPKVGDTSAEQIDGEKTDAVLLSVSVMWLVTTLDAESIDVAGVSGVAGVDGMDGAADEAVDASVAVRMGEKGHHGLLLDHACDA